MAFQILAPPFLIVLDHSSPNKFNVLSPHSDRWHSNHISPPRKNFQPAETSTPTPKNRAAPQGRKQSLVTNLVINFQSLKNKIPTFSTHISENPADIIYGTETWLHNKIKDAELLLDDYDLYRKERPGNANFTSDIGSLSEEERRRKKVGGGVLLAVKKSLASKPINTPIKSESVYCQITQTGKPPLIIGCVYRPP